MKWIDLLDLFLRCVTSIFPSSIIGEPTYYSQDAGSMNVEADVAAFMVFTAE